MIAHGTPEWWEARRGLPTASRLDDMMAAKGQGETTLKYVAERLAERLGIELPDFTSREMEWGITYEPDAIAAYEAATFRKVSQPSFHIIDLDGLAFGATPDGLIGDDGLLEVKCPASVTHILNFKKGIATKYYFQVQGELMATGRKWADFVSFDPRNVKHPIYIERILPDEGTQTLIKAAVQNFYRIMADLESSMR
jgi:hypothetical protein